MKKIVAWFTLAVLMLSACGFIPAGAEQPDTLVVGHTTRLSGSFFSEMWGNNTADIDVRELLHGYHTVVWTEEGDLFVNRQVVEQIDKGADGQGNTVMEVRLKPGLRFSDGSPITAKDYVFSILLESSPLIRQLDGQAVIKGFIVGLEDFAKGLSPTITGLRLLDERRFSVTVKKDALPYFYELAYAHAQPYPVSVIAPGCEVSDDGQGVYMSGPFTAELLKETILNPQTGYLSHPGVVSGPYTLLSFDRETTVAEFERNPYFTGNHEGVVPTIQKLVFKEIKNDHIIEALGSGEYGLVNKISSGEVIDQLEALGGQIASNVSYPRSGLGFVAFGAEQGFGSSALLRKAIAHLIDKNIMVSDFLRGHGEPVYGYYGLAQWMVRARKGSLKQLDIYPFSLEAAAGFLDQDGWNLDKAGQPYAPGAGQRYKKLGDYLMPLSLRMAISPDNAAANLAVSLLRDNLERVGGKLSVDTIPMTELLEHYYRQLDRSYDLFFLGSNFSFVFDPYYNYSPDPAFQGAYNTSGVRDEELFRLATVLRQTPPGSKELYLDRWLDFQKGWVEVLPFVPLYSNYYSDGFTPRLTHYHPDRYTSWAIAILYASLE